MTMEKENEAIRKLGEQIDALRIAMFSLLVVVILMWLQSFFAIGSTLQMSDILIIPIFMLIIVNLCLSCSKQINYS